MPDLSIVYVLSNPAMPGLVKIGHTTQQDVQIRLMQLYGSGVPFPFKLEFACKVPNPEEVERALHQAFSPNRINPRREFFSIESSQAIAILKLLHVEDATEEVAPAAAAADVEGGIAAEQYRARRPNLNFEEMGIPIGSRLQSIHGDAMVVVVGPRKVRLEDDELSLTAATRQVMGLDYNVQPGPHWRFDGKLLRDIYNETYEEEA